MTGRDDLSCIFNPQSIAVAGVSVDSDQTTGGGRTYVKALLRCNYKGGIYPINPKGGEVYGLKIYPNVRDVPDRVDYVICCIPAPLVPKLIEDCVAKGVGAVQFLTSGFRENQSPEGVRLEDDICRLAAQGGVRLLGPNCVGMYCPSVGVSFAPDLPAQGGSVAFLCQSGGNALYFTRFAASRGVHFSKVVSYGNACDIDECDLLEYLIADPETEIVAMYVEGVKDSQRFSKILKQLGWQKPVILMKGGNTEAASRTVASHTAALTGANEAWEGLLRQSGVIRVSNLEEMLDVIIAFLYLPVPRGRRLGSIGIGGGATVLAADTYPSFGFVLPPLSPEMKHKIRSFIDTDAGLTLDNPMDYSSRYYTPAIYPALKALADYNEFDMLVFHMALSIIPPIYSSATDDAIAELEHVIKVRRETTKPLAAVISNFVAPESWETAFECAQRCAKHGVPVYFYVGNAARALDRFCQYHERRARLV